MNIGIKDVNPSSKETIHKSILQNYSERIKDTTSFEDVSDLIELIPFIICNTGMFFSLVSEETPLYFKLSRGEANVYLKQVIIPLTEAREYYKKEGKLKKVYISLVINIDRSATVIRLADSDIELKCFKRKLRSILNGKGVMSPQQYWYMHQLFTIIASEGLNCIESYTQQGLSIDLNKFMYKYSVINVRNPDAISNRYQKDLCCNVFTQIMKCAETSKNIPLSLVAHIGWCFEFLQSLSPSSMRNLLPTTLPLIYGGSGTGKTTLVKAIFDSDYQNRFIALSNSTKNGVMEKMCSIYGGTIILDDIPHISLGKCSKAVLDCFEMILRTYGDIGAEKQTAFKQNQRVRAWAAVTAEAPFLNIQSSLLRVFPIEILRGDVHFDELEKLVEMRSDYDKYIVIFLNWFCQHITVGTDGFIKIPLLEKKYAEVRAEAYSKYKNIREARLIDTRIQFESYWNFFCVFYESIGINPGTLEQYSQLLNKFLMDTANMQADWVHDSTLESCIIRAISDLIESSGICKYKTNLEIIQNSNTSNIAAFRDNNFIVFTSHQKRIFFNMIREKAGTSDITDNIIVNSMITMGIVCVPSTSAPVKSGGYDNRITENGQSKRVLKIDIRNLEV